MYRSVCALVLGVALGCGGGGSDLPDARVAPLETVIDEAPPASTNVAVARFAFHASRDATFTCRVDDAVVPGCTSPFEIEVDDGAHTFTVAAADLPEVGAAVDDTPAIAVWSLDRVAPETTLLGGPADVDNASSPRFFFTSADPDATFLCALDGGEPVACTAPWQIGPLAAGTHTVVIVAVDAAGNLDPSPLEITWTIDLSVPDTIIDAGPAALVGATAEELVFSAPDAGPGATFACSVDGAAFAACTSPLPLTGLATGLHVAQVQVTSAAGTVDPSPATWIWEVDATAPVVALVGVPAATSYDRTPTFATLVSEDHGPVTWTCTLDGGAPIACGSPWTPTPLAFGAHTVVVAATDVVGNTGSDTYSWTVASLCATNNGGCGSATTTACAQPDDVAVCTCQPGYVDVAGTCDRPWVQDAYLKASNTDAGDVFGIGWALSGDGTRLAVGAPYEASAATGVDGNQLDNTAGFSGAVYIFVRTGGVWSQEAYLKASNTGAGDYFGWSVALSDDGSRLVVGAPREASNATGVGGNQASNTASQAGAAYVFTRTGSVWSQEAYLKASNTGASDQFGQTVAISGDGVRIAVAAVGEASAAPGVGGNQADNTAFNAGAVYVFARAGTWAQEAYVKATAPDDSDLFGYYALALSTDGSRLAVGASGEDSGATGVGGDDSDDSVDGAGAAYVYDRVGTTWSVGAYLKASNPEASDSFGYELALSGDGTRLAITAYNEDSAATGVGGDQSSNATANAGAAYVFAWSGTAWSQEAYVKATNPGPNDYFGWSVTLSGVGDRLVVGAINEASAAVGVNGDQTSNAAGGARAAYVYHRGGSPGAPHADLKASNTGGGDRFGGVSLSTDGKLLAVSADSEDGAATGVGGDQSSNAAANAGAGYVLRLNE
ncbi:MAG: hypothetical protein R2939_22850 [Kofleriaceae bacterium]